MMHVYAVNVLRGSSLYERLIVASSVGNAMTAAITTIPYATEDDVISVTRGDKIDIVEP